MKHVKTIALATVIASLTLIGCTSINQTGPGMMGYGSALHSAKLTCRPPANLPGRTVNVLLGDMGMDRMMNGVMPLGAHMRLVVQPATFPAGQVSVVVRNMGWRTHELVILPLADGQFDGQRVPGADGKVDETGSLAEASTTCGAGAGGGVKAGAVTWTTVTLTPGRYEFVCNLQDHYASGMHQEVLVTAS